MQIFKLGSYPIEQRPDLDGLERQHGGWCAGLTFPMRLLALSKRFDMARPIARIAEGRQDIERLARNVAPLLTEIEALFQSSPGADPATLLRRMDAAHVGVLMDLFADDPLLQHVLAAADTVGGDDGHVLWSALGDALDDILDGILWRLPIMGEMERFYEQLQQHHLRSATYLLLAWPPPDVSPETIAATLRHATGRTVQILDQLPSVIDGPYEEQRTRLKPEVVGTPWLATLLAYDVRGVWNATTLHGLLSLPSDVALAIDVHTLTRNKAMRTAELAYNGARLLARDTKILDLRAHRVIDSARQVLHALVHESLHTVQIAVLVGGATEEQLETNVAEIKSRLGTQLRLMRPPGVQGEILKFWSGALRNQIEAPLKPRSMLSHGVGCCMGVLGYHRPSMTDGPLWGLDGMRRAPLFNDLFAGNQAGHFGIFGKSGKGKTLFLNVITLRAAALENYRVIGIDDFDNGPRIAAAAPGGAHCYMLGMDKAINILDVVYADEDDEPAGSWRTRQIQHVIGQLSLLLGKPGKTKDDKDCLISYDFEVEEIGLLNRALDDLYADVDPKAPLDQTPLLSDLIVILEALSEHEALRLARKLRLQLFGTEDRTSTRLTPLGACFSRHTEVDWRFGSDITYYNTRRVPEQYRPFFYLQLIGAIMRFMRDPHRDLSRYTLLAIDEFGYVTQVEALSGLAANITKVARKYKIALVPIDQNPLTFLESQNGRKIFENLAAKFIFHLDDIAAHQIGAAIGDLTPEHIDFLIHAQVGECLAVFGNDVYVMLVEPNPLEKRALIGS